MFAGRRWPSLFVAAAMIVVTAPQLLRATPAVAELPAPPWTVSVSPAGPYVDGQPLSVTLRAPSTATLYAAVVHVCRAGIAYAMSTGPTPADDFGLGREHCTPLPVSSSGLFEANVLTAASEVTSPQGSTTVFPIGKGSVGWKDFNQVDRTLTCDVGAPCSLVVEVRGVVDGKATWVPFVHELSFKEDDPIKGCGGPATGLLRTGASDRFTTPYITWTLAECRAPGRTGAATQAILTGEAPSMEQYEAGFLDLVYTGAGHRSGVLLEAVDGAEARRSVAVPLAVNAAVLAVAGGTRNDAGRVVPFTDIRLTAEEAAALISGGTEAITPFVKAIFDRNPELTTTGIFATGAPFVVGASAEGDVVNHVMTDFLDQVVPATWRVPDSPSFGDQRGRDRGASASFATADPPFNLTVSTVSGRPGFKKAFGVSTFAGGIWIVTDRLTAREFGWTTVKISNAAGQLVEPTDAALLAAASAMSVDDDGIAVPDPRAVTPVGGVVPYPLTFIEYALVPEAPLLTPDCELRPASQLLLDDWLLYITGPGQDTLPSGLLPLTPALTQQANDARALVGRGDVTGPCALVEELALDDGVVEPDPVLLEVTEPDGDQVVPSPTTLDAPTPAVSSGAPVTSSTQGGGSSALAPPPPPPVSVPAASGAAPTTEQPAAEEAQLISVPGFAGRVRSSLGGALIGLLGITLLGTMAAVVGASRARRRPA